MIDTYVTDLEGLQQITWKYELTAPDTLGEYPLRVQGLFNIKDEWIHDESGWYKEFNVNIGENNTSIPWFPVIAVIIGLITFYLILRKINLLS